LRLVRSRRLPQLAATNRAPQRRSRSAEASDFDPAGLPRLPRVSVAGVRGRRSAPGHPWSEPTSPEREMRHPHRRASVSQVGEATRSMTSISRRLLGRRLALRYLLARRLLPR
jgi:hypothetical protein